MTQLWTPDHEKEHRSEPIKRGRFVGGGYLIHYNGLELRLLWLEQGKEFYQRVVIHDREEQLKKIREFWKTRYRDFPEEFSTRKVAK